MKENVRMFIIVMGFFIAGMLAGYASNELLSTTNFAETCNDQCNLYMEEFCICNNDWDGNQPQPMDFNWSRSWK